jgi:hypothetical protein
LANALPYDHGVTVIETLRASFRILAHVTIKTKRDNPETTSLHD